ncbi:unnamed protein product [Closterium sp. NIES-65]|nr:unnamed protein product [Closterium sp. NIES-65]
MASAPQPPHPAAPDTRGVGPTRRTVASNTSPRALRAARRGKESQPHEQQREELVGRVEITAPREAAGEQEPVEGEAAAAAAAGGSGAMGTESEAAVTVEAAAAAGLEGVAAEATEMVAAAELGGPDAASGGGSASPSAIPQAWQPEEPGPPVAQERTEAVELVAPPENVTAPVLAAAVAAASGEQGGARTEEGAPVAVATRARASLAICGDKRREKGSKRWDQASTNTDHHDRERSGGTINATATASGFAELDGGRGENNHGYRHGSTDPTA